MAESKSRILRIAGRDYKIRGAESEEQLRRVERCLNDKIGELKKLFSVQGMDFETITMLAAINLADDYISAEAELKQLKQVKIKAERLMKREKNLEAEVERLEEEVLKLESENQDYADRLKKIQKGLEK
ncbi:MAG: cell division protein ZapA [Firmicutes bacterium]|nr:cell division protein ZapA [Bacillota bacterium]